MWRCCHGPVHCLWFVTNFCDGDDNNSGDFCAYVQMKHCHWLKYFDEYSVFTLLMNMHSTVLWLEVKVSIFGHCFIGIKCMLWYCLLSSRQYHNQYHFWNRYSCLLADRPAGIMLSGRTGVSSSVFSSCNSMLPDCSAYSFTVPPLAHCYQTRSDGFFHPDNFVHWWKFGLPVKAWDQNFPLFSSHRFSNEEFWLFH